MIGLRAKAVLLSALMLAALAVAEGTRPRTRLADGQPELKLDVSFPKSFGDWRIDDQLPVVLPAPDVQARLNAIYSEVLARTYVNSRGDRIMLSVAYGGDQSDATKAHMPETCYPAQGFQVTANDLGSVALPDRSLPVRKLMTHLNDRYEPITYWMVVGDKATASSTQQRLAQLSYGVRGLVPDGILVRVSSIDRVPERAYAVQARFISDLSVAMPADRRARLIGANSP